MTPELRQVSKWVRNNRNILECKCLTGILDFPFLPEIIETYWNVNALKYSNAFSSGLRNNRNILECK